MEDLHIGNHIIKIEGIITIDNNFRGNLLSLFFIDGIKAVDLSNLSGDLRKAVEILNEFLPVPTGKRYKSIIECQSKLLDTDLDIFVETSEDFRRDAVVTVAWTATGVE